MTDLAIYLDTPADLLRQVNALLCLLAFAGLVYRLIGWWPAMGDRARFGLSLFTVLELVVSLGTARRATLGGPFNEVQYFVLLHAVATLVFIVAWPRLSVQR